MSGGKTIVAVLADEAKMRSALGRLLGTHGFEVELFATGDEFLQAAQCRCPDCVLMDLHMHQTTGFDVLRALTRLEIRVPSIVITGHDEPGNAERAYQLGAAAYLLKPVDESILVNAIQRACLQAGPAPDYWPDLSSSAPERIPPATGTVRRPSTSLRARSPFPMSIRGC